MPMDKLKAILGSITMLGMFALPLIAFVVGWNYRDTRTGIILALIAFGVCFLLSALFFTSMEKPSALLSSIPFILSMVYTISPDLPGPIDDSVIQLGGSVLSYLMWAKRDTKFPRWAIIPLALASGYHLLGIAVPGPIDELLANALAVAGIYMGRKRDPGQP